MVPLLAMYYIFPFLRWDRGASAPDQAVMVDLVGRKLYFFGLEVWPQEVYLLTGLLMLAAFVLFFVTAMAGRVWCAYACPQTVWTDLFMMIERWFEGDRHRRVRLDEAPWTVSKLVRKGGKHGTWLLVSLLTGGAWVLYFTDAPTFVQDALVGDIPFAAGFWVLFLTTSTYILAGHAREQVCTYMCPYARFQGAMYDADTLIVSYDEARGEPRGKKGAEGDCIDCNRCVAVCPVGIDIRDGQQYQCITCGLCIDACNTVMRKVGKPEGHIRYNTLNNTLDGFESFFKAAHKLRIIRPRTLIYTAILAVVSSALLYVFTIGRVTVDLNVLRDRNPMFVQMASGDIRNVYTLRVVNKKLKDSTYRISLDGVPQAKLSIRKQNTLPNGAVDVMVPAGKVGTFRTFVDMPKAQATGMHNTLTFRLKGVDNADEYSSVFIGPKKQKGQK